MIPVLVAKYAIIIFFVYSFNKRINKQIQNVTKAKKVRVKAVNAKKGTMEEAKTGGGIGSVSVHEKT